MALFEQRSGGVDEEARRRFEQAWAANRPHRIEEFLPDETQPSYLGTLEELVLIDLEFGWRSATHRHTPASVMPDSVSRQDPSSHSRSATPATPPEAAAETFLAGPSVETYLVRFPQLRHPEIVRRLVAEEIRVRRQCGDNPDLDSYQQRFPDLDLTIAMLPAGRETGDGSETPREVDRGPSRPPLPRRFGAYELLDEIGAGGMGLVYRARQSGAERDVALKVLRIDRFVDLPAQWRHGIVERFRTEARATARIDHPGIVTVYDVGEADGFPFYTMRYVQGASLAELLRRGSITARTAVRHLQLAAEAVQSAHDHGVLHRDLKPHNIIIEEASGRAFVADFGLAKLVEEDISQTLTGEVLGTPCYMSPEQARSSGSATTRSDVYSLGATLYHLLTGRLPFLGRSHAEILTQVIGSDPTPPRELNPALDPDLEVICLTCLSKEPEQRYASAGALAADLRCWLAGEPIAARPPGRWERVRRWTRKNPVLSSLTAASVFLLVFAVAALWTGYSSATTAWRRSEASDREARATVNEFTTIVSEDLLLNQPALQPLRRELLERALAHYERFLADRGEDPQLREEIAATQYRIGRIVELLDSSSQAAVSYRRAIALQRDLLAEAPGDLSRAAALSTALNALGACETRLGRLDEALASFAEARGLRESVVKQDPGDVESQRLLANSVMNIGLVRKSQRDQDEARRELEQSVAMRQPWLDGSPARWKLARDQGMAHFNLANLEIDADRLDVAEARLLRAIEQFEQVAGRTPEDLELRGRLALCDRLLGELRTLRSEFVGAAEAYERAQVTLEDLSRENPRVPQFREELARLFLMQGELAVQRGDRDGAAGYFMESRRLLAPLAEGENALPENRADLAKSLQALAAVHLQRGERPEALARASEARSVLERLVVRVPEEPQYAQQLEATQRFIERASSPAQPDP